MFSALKKFVNRGRTAAAGIASKAPPWGIRTDPVNNRSRIQGLGRSMSAGSLGRMAVGGAVGMYSSRNEEGWGFAGGIAGGMAGGALLGKYMPSRAGTWGLKQLKSSKSFAAQYTSKGTGLGGFAKRNLNSSALRSTNRAMQYAGIAGAAGIGAGLGSSTLRSNNPY